MYKIIVHVCIIEFKHAIRLNDTLHTLYCSLIYDTQYTKVTYLYSFEMTCWFMIQSDTLPHTLQTPLQPIIFIVNMTSLATFHNLMSSVSYKSKMSIKRLGPWQVVHKVLISWQKWMSLNSHKDSTNTVHNV